MADARIDTPAPIDAPPADADITSPGLFEVLPMANAMDVPRTTVVSVQFDEAVQNVNVGSFYLRDGTTAIPATISNVDPQNHVLTPSALLPASTVITVFLTTAITDTSGNMFFGVTYSFTTGM
ncbi:MAG TPA: Ig-like domain-containing protein [Kofleriaceae bacterium]